MSTKLLLIKEVAGAIQGGHDDNDDDDDDMEGKMTAPSFI